MKRLPHVLVGVSLAALVCFTSVSSSADDVADEADLHFQLGADRYQARDYRGALDHFLMSNRLVPNRNVLFNIARSYEQLGQFPDAYRYYMQALQGETDAASRERIQSAIVRITPNVAVLRIETDPPGATIYVDRKDLGARGTAPRVMAYDPGQHRVIVEMPGYRVAQSELLEFRKGEETKVSLRLEQIVGTVKVERAPDGATVGIDDPQGTKDCVPPCVVKVSPGKHTVYLNHPRFEPSATDIAVGENQTIIVRPVLRELQGTLVVNTEERDALIEIDGRPAGFTPAVLSVQIGMRKVKVSRAGFVPTERTLEIKPHKETRFNVDLQQMEEVNAASRVTQAVKDAPSSVSIISLLELRAMAYPTIAEAVRGTRGVYVSDDRAYKSIGLRGLHRPGDYSNRVLVLLDGHPTNDDWIGSSYVDFDGRTDLEDIERIEVIRGPGSVLYGTNAFSGVINLVSRGRDQPTGGSVGVSTVENGTARARGMVNVQLGKDSGFWVSAAGAHSEGQDFYFREFDDPSVPGPNNDGWARGLDGFDSGTIHARGWTGPLIVQAFIHTRDKKLPTGGFGSIFGDPRTSYGDRRGFIEGRLEPKLSESVQLFIRGYLNHYRFDGSFGYPELDGGASTERFLGTWAGGEGRIVLEPTEAVRLTVGGEGQHHFQVDQYGRTEAEVYIDRSDPYSFGAGYASADLSPGKALRLSLGARADWYTTFGTSINPRAAIILRPYEAGNIKLMGGKAFRAPSVYELYYNDGGITHNASPDLGPETIWSPELEFSHEFTPTWTGTVAGFGNYVDSIVVSQGEGTQLSPTYFVNSSAPVLTLGAEAVLRKEWRRGWMLAISYGYQHSKYLEGDKDPSEPDRREVPNVPSHMGSLRGAVPILARSLVAATRLSFESARYDAYDEVPAETDPDRERKGQTHTDPSVVWDIVLSGKETRTGVDYAVGIYNAFDWRYSVPVSREYVQRAIPQSGRTLLLSASVSF